VGRQVSKQVTGQIRSTFGRNQPTGDVWGSATANPTPDDAPECAWCPLCRAARVLRESKPGRDTRVTAVSDALGMVVQDAFNVLDAALATTGRPPPPQDGQRPAAGQAAQAGQAGQAKSGTPGRSTAGQAGRSTAGQAAKTKNGTARPRPDDEPAAEHEPPVATTAERGQGEEPAPEPPVGSPHEPDDRD
jgi:hypothetical protein